MAIAPIHASRSIIKNHGHISDYGIRQVIIGSISTTLGYGFTDLLPNVVALQDFLG
ncbi:MAG: hypothetical protein F6K09_14705 [Merismopedia sp. SIO2A8]|nr:hypothetical protein [Merismopedia sp. SIO2A8]